LLGVTPADHNDLPGNEAFVSACRSAVPVLKI